jgi:serine/threonine-protein kinase PpkA
LSHNNLITVHDIGQGDGFYYIVMEYLSGGDLKARIAQGMKPGQALKTLARLAGCLGYVHGLGIIHRDIKPSNILFRGDGTPVLSDFGIAKLTQSDSDLTVTGTVMGSPHYLSPEQAQGMRELDGRADLYSMGVLLFEMLTGRKPFAGDNFTATLIAHIKQPIPRLPPHLTRLQPLVDRLLAKKPEERFRTGAELVKAIQQLRISAPQVQRPLRKETPPEEPADSIDHSEETLLNHSMRWRRPVYAVLVVMVGVLLFRGLSREQEPLEPSPEGVTASHESTPPLPAPELAENQADPVADGASEGATPAAMTATERVDTTSLRQPPDDREVTETAQAVDEIPRWLEQADRRLQENRLSRPRGDSARDFYRKVLEREPKNHRALSGLKHIADRYAWFARSNLAKGERERARGYVRMGLQTQPGRTDLKLLEKSLKQQGQTVTPPPTPPQRKPANPDKGSDEAPMFNVEHNS